MSDVKTFIAQVQERLSGASVAIDEPDDPAGEWWLDLSCGRFHSSVAWQVTHGFGIFTSEAAFGDRPEEVYRRPELAAQRMEQLYEHWSISKTLVPLWLPDMRKLAGTPQTVLAKALDCNQPSVSRFEQREDVKLSTLAAYIAAMGGRLEVRVHFDDWDARIALPHFAHL